MAKGETPLSISMTAFKGTLFGWLIWVTSLASIYIFDYVIRLNKPIVVRSGGQNPWITIDPFGIPPLLMSGMLLICGSIALFFIDRSFRDRSKLIRAFVLVIHLTLGFLFYGIVAFAYVLGTGVDSL